MSNDKSFNGLFALLKVASEVEKQTQEISSSRNCENRFCTGTRRKSFKLLQRKINGVHMWVCEKCASAYSLKRYCKHCKETYANIKGLKEHGWLQCNSCKRWSHAGCEKAHGSKKNIEALLLDPSFVFCCGECEKINLSGKKLERRVAKKRPLHAKRYLVATR